MFKKGQSGNPAGKQAGTKHWTTVKLKECFLGVFDMLGGQAKLVEYAQKSDENYIEVIRMVARLLPKEITGPEGGDLQIVIKKVLERAPD